MRIVGELVAREFSRLGLVLVLLCEGMSFVYAEEPPPDLPRNPSSGMNQVGSLSEFFKGRTPYEFWLTTLIMLFGLVVIAMLLWFGRRGNNRPEEMARHVIVVFVVSAALILVTAGYSNDQIAPAFGLLGTIVGYVLGRLGVKPGANGNVDPQA
ncbi:hypothetical protein IVB33_30230 [Bradyrhizobium sp. 24]|nr:hypothetical protein [Bradyrhizobium sp. 134]MCK1381171.1 hypothetical protein [Bradyrhizobium sp. 24]